MAPYPFIKLKESLLIHCEPGSFGGPDPRFTQLAEESVVLEKSQLSSDQNPGYLLYRGDYTTQIYGDCNKPL